MTAGPSDAEEYLLESLTRTTHRETNRFLARRPYENVFMQWVLAGGHGQSAPEEFVLHRARDGRLTGVMYVGLQAVLAADDDAAVDAFAVELRRHPHMRSFVGAAHVIERLWDDVKLWHPAPALRRPHQPLYALQRNALPPAAGAPVRRATLADADIVIDNSAQMMLGELGYDPRRNRPAFAAGVRRAIALGTWWVWIAEGELRFQCNVGAHTRATAQIQGVWTPPPARKRGFATAALAAVALRLLEKHDTLSLYVNDFNAGAIALYERLGFVCVGELATLIF